MNDSDNVSLKKILDEYDRDASTFRDFKNNCGRLVAELLRIEHIRVHSVTARVKDREKLREKINREGKSYSCIGDITDVIGIRIITHFEDEVDKIGSLVEREFVINPEKSVDKRKLLDPDRFGYLSLHYICSLSSDRLKLAENRRFKDLVCEIQIRSILQHAWAEIEHDLGYKTGSAIPAPIRRRFSRLAGLLEIADQEFAAIRNDLAEYESRIKTEIKTAPSEVGIDKISLRAFVSENSLLIQLEDEILRSINAKSLTENDGLLQVMATILPTLSINTIDQLEAELKRHKGLLLYEAKNRLHKHTGGVTQGFSLLHLALVLMVLTGGEERIKKGLKDIGATDDEKLSTFIQEIIKDVHKYQQMETI